MPFLTLNQAAKASKRAKSTLLEALENGRLSGSKDERNRWQIDPAELFRVYPVDRTKTIAENQNRTGQENQKTDIFLEKIRHLEAALEALGRERDDLKGQRDILRAESERLLTVIEEQVRTVKALTHQRPANENRPAVRVWLWATLALIAAGAIILGGFNPSFFRLP